MEKLSPLYVVQNEHCKIGTGAEGFISLASKPRMPRVHKLPWKDDKSSIDWLRRISDVNSSLAVDDQPRNQEFDEELFYNSEGTSELPADEGKSDLIDGCFHEESSFDPEVDNNCESRKPDSTYISTISQINVSICLSDFSTRSSADFDDNLTLPFLLQSKIDPEKLLQVNDPSQQSALFTQPTERNTQAKRKTSFEYIQEVSLLQYGQNSVDIRR